MAPRISHTSHPHPATAAGRTACREAANISLTDAVDALRACSSVEPNSREWHMHAKKHEAACLVHADLTNQRYEAVVLKVGLIVSMLPRAW